MRREAAAFLWDVESAASAVEQFTRGKTLEDFLGDPMVQAAVERKFEIIGEALSQLAKMRPDLSARIPDLREIIGFRNVLIHRYAAVDHRLVWRTIQTRVQPLRAIVDSLLREVGGSPSPS
ncbi:MAG: DUF86 domain-containing protein [Deltaproteobacteria bacterium]|nr:DUF86 domain-containing protein [Deltaproteobacteria bacterium]